MRFVVSKDAERDLAQIFRYWAERVSFEVADRIIDTIVERFSLIAKFPEVGRHSDDLSTGLLRVSAGQYVIYYRKLRRVIRIVHVLHGVRDQRRGF